MNGIAAPIVAVEPAPTPDVLRPRRSVSVVMVVYMTGEALEQSLACVLADPLVDEFVIVDNGSTPDEAERLRGAGRARPARGAAGRPRQRRLRPRRQPGRAQGRAATSWCSSTPTPSCSRAASPSWSREIEGRPAPCIVGGRVLNADRTEQRGAPARRDHPDERAAVA